MKFLVIMKSKHVIPPEMLTGVYDGSIAWGRRYLASKKMEQAWAFAGLPAGAGVLNVNSAEELNQIMAECPLAGFAETQIYALADFEKSLTQVKEVILAMVKK